MFNHQGCRFRPASRRFGVRIPAATEPAKLLKQVVTVPLQNARHYVRMSQVFGDDHFERMPRVTIGVARYRTLTTQLA